MIKISKARQLRAKIEDKRFLCPRCRGYRADRFRKMMQLVCDACGGEGSMSIDQIIAYYENFYNGDIDEIYLIEVGEEFQEVEDG